MKKFTCTAKWKDKWHRSLSSAHKLAWSFLNDECDHAGVIDTEDSFVAFMIGEPSFTLAEFAEVAGSERFVQLPNGKWWLPKYVAFQHAGGISAKKKPHQPAIRSIIKNQLPVTIGNDSEGTYRIHNEWVMKTSLSPIPYPSERNVLPKSYVTDKVQDKDRDKDKEKEGGAGGRIEPFERPPSREELKQMEIPTTDELAVDLERVFLGKINQTRNAVMAYIGALNSGSEKFTPESWLHAYMERAASRDLCTWERNNRGRPLSPINWMADLKGFIADRMNRKDFRDLVLRSASKPTANPMFAPCDWWREICMNLYDGTKLHEVDEWIDLPLSARQGIWKEFFEPVHTQAVASRHA